MALATSDAIWLLVQKLGIIDASQCRFCQAAPSSLAQSLGNSDGDLSPNSDDDDNDVPMRDIRRGGRDEKDNSKPQRGGINPSSRLLTIKPRGMAATDNDEEAKTHVPHATIRVTKARSHIGKTLPPTADCKQCNGSGRVIKHNQSTQSHHCMSVSISFRLIVSYG